MKDNNFLDPEPQKVDRILDLRLRPKNFAEFVGQKQLIENLQVFIQAAKKRKEPIEHLLFYGPPGLGKTTLAHVIAHETGANIRVTSGPVIDRPGDLAAIITALEPGDILFIDEIHRLNRQVEEMLYPAMEEMAVDIVLGKGPGARTMRLDLPHFTLIGATTRISLLSSPLRDRFGFVDQLEFYNNEEITKILKRSAKILNIVVDQLSFTEISRRSRKTPRVANRLLKRLRDFAQVANSDKINKKLILEVFEKLSIDEWGLDKTDHKILRTIAEKFSGGPVGIETIAAATSEERATVEDVYEPYLMQIGFLERTSKGRKLTELAFKHLGLKLEQDKKKLF